MPRLLIEAQFTDQDGNPLSGGQVTYYESGTTTLKNTYSDDTYTTLNTNPIILDAHGRCGDVWFEGKAKMVIRDAAGVAIPNGTFDPIYATTGGSSGNELVWRFWSGSVEYDAGDLVVDSNDCWQISIGNSNLNNDPTSTSGYWVEHSPIFTWDSTYSFKSCQYAYYSGLIYKSKVSSNLNNTPTLHEDTYWLPTAQKYSHTDLGTITGGTNNLDVSLYNSFKFTVSTGTSTIALTNEPAVTVMYTFDITIINGGLYPPTFPATFEWTDGVTPTWTSSGTDMVTVVKLPNDTAHYAQVFTRDSS